MQFLDLGLSYGGSIDSFTHSFTNPWLLFDLYSHQKPPSVAVKPVANKSLHCELVPPCPCPEYEALENGSCLCSGNAWGEEIDDEVTRPNTRTHL